MVGEKGPPSLRRRVPTADHVLAHTGLADVDAELQKLAVNPRSAPSAASPSDARRPAGDEERGSQFEVRRGCGTKPKRLQTTLRKPRCARINVRGATSQCISQIQIYENQRRNRAQGPPPGGSGEVGHLPSFRRRAPGVVVVVMAVSGCDWNAPEAVKSGVGIPGRSPDLHYESGPDAARR
jgi:hypothetical protein